MSSSIKGDMSKKAEIISFSQTAKLGKRVCHHLVGDNGRRGSMKFLTNGDKGEEGKGNPRVNILAKNLNLFPLLRFENVQFLPCFCLYNFLDFHIYPFTEFYFYQIIIVSVFIRAYPEGLFLFSCLGF